MKLREMRTDDLDTVASWLGKKENYRWLEFGRGAQKIGLVTLRMMMQRDIHKLWTYTYTADDSDEPSGLVGFSDIHSTFKSAVAWFVLGKKMAARQHYTSRAVGHMIIFGFEDMDLHSIYAWTLEHNAGGQKILERNNFRFIGIRRQCHFIEGKAYDRLLYDLLKDEYNKKVDDE